MPRNGGRSDDGKELERYLRDLAALTALPAIWSTADRPEIAESLADVLVKVLEPDFVYVRFESFGIGDALEVARAGSGQDLAGLCGALRASLPTGTSGAAVVSLPLPLAGGLVQAAVTPIGYGCEFGALVAAWGQPGCPSEEHRLLLSVTANQAAFVVERLRAEGAQALFAAIVESSEDAIISKTLDGVITSWNVGAERLFGYAAEEAVGRSITLIIPPERGEEERLVLERLRRGERIEHYETIRRSKQGRLMDISLTISPIRDRSGRIIGASKVARDITRRKEVERALEEADRRKNEFLAILSHELRNPLAPIRNAAQILRVTAPPLPELQWARDVIDRQVQQMTRLVDDLFDVSRITRGKMVLRKRRVDLAAVVTTTVEASRPTIEKRGHDLTVVLPPESIHLEADPTRLAQILSNLLNNAAKYTDRGGRIALTAERNGDGVCIRVKDTGIGMPAEMLPRVFDMFTQVEPSLDRSQGGLGIGLTLVQRLVQLHGGAVEAHSDGLGMGSEFVVRLPIARARDGEKAAAPAGARDGEKPVALRAGYRILVVDDNQDAADSLAVLLRMSGNEVHTARDGLEAVGAAAAFEPDVVLLDIGLPKLNGYEAARRIREERGDGIVLIALTGWGQEEHRRRSKEAGFDHHLTKPVEFEALQQLLSKTNP